MFVQEAGEQEGTWEESELSQSIHRKISTASEMPTIPHYSSSPLGGKEFPCCLTCLQTSIL